MIDIIEGLVPVKGTRCVQIFERVSEVDDPYIFGEGHVAPLGGSIINEPGEVCVTDKGCQSHIGVVCDTHSLVAKERRECSTVVDAGERCDSMQ